VTAIDYAIIVLALKDNIESVVVFVEGIDPFLINYPQNDDQTGRNTQGET
jgi:hypothetical protein